MCYFEPKLTLFKWNVENQPVSFHLRLIIPVNDIDYYLNRIDVPEEGPDGELLEITVFLDNQNARGIKAEWPIASTIDLPTEWMGDPDLKLNVKVIDESNSNQVYSSTTWLAKNIIEWSDPVTVIKPG